MLQYQLILHKIVPFQFERKIINAFFLQKKKKFLLLKRFNERPVKIPIRETKNKKPYLLRNGLLFFSHVWNFKQRLGSNVIISCDLRLLMLFWSRSVVTAIFYCNRCFVAQMVMTFDWKNKNVIAENVPFISTHNYCLEITWHNYEV